MSDDTVRVAVRIRPLIKTEVDRGCQTCLDVIPGEPQIHIRSMDKAFTFNYVFPPDIDQVNFYNTAIKEMVQNIFQGYNVTILAYGQTGSGKTHSMGTDYSGVENMGVIPRAIHDIFDIVKSKKDWSFKITVSFMELYQEQLYDLLTDKQRAQSVVDIREDGKSIKVVGVTEKEVTSANKALECLTQGSLGRATGATAMNAHSSRSHAIFTLCIYQQKEDDPNTATTAKFHLVDLAGSERSKKTQATGERFKEGVNINKGLLALGNVISQLGEGSSVSYICYRDSKLTRLLQDSLGGNSMTLMIACVSPADYNLDETLSTLRYADRARKIKNKPIVNQDPKISEINRLNKLVQELRLAFMGRDINTSCPIQHQELQEKNKLLQKKLRDLTEKLNANLIEIVFMHERAELAEQAREKIKSDMAIILEDCKKLLSNFDENPDSNKEHRNQLEAIYLKILDIQKDQKKASEELLNYEISLSSELPPEKNNEDMYLDDLNAEDADSINDFNEKHEEHTLRQAERNNEVQNINRELAIKESLVSQLLKNSSQADYFKELQDMEQEVRTLQSEKEELVQALRNVHANNVSSKLAETRRKKVQELEKKIAQLSQKCLEQTKTLKRKEKSDQQIKNLSNEIQSLKQTRVKLIKQMRTEADRFTKWKQCREKELNKLRDLDRKRANEVASLKMQHNKQQNVFKRKMEEAAAANKRLKEALEMQRKAIQRREKTSNSKDEIQTWVTQELEVLLSTIDAEYSLQKLIQGKASLARQVDRRKDDSDIDKEELTELTELLDSRNAEIVDLQQKILESDQENRANTRWHMIQTMADAKAALKILFEISAENRRKQCMERIQYEELQEKLEQYQRKEKLLKNEKKKVFIENSNNRNVKPAVKLNSTEDAEAAEGREHGSYILTDDSLCEDDVTKDPDWTKTPLYSRLQKLWNTTKNPAGDRNMLKRSSDGNIKCACKTKCATRLCTCRKNDVTCNNCNCNPEICQNKDKENVARTLFLDYSEIPRPDESIKRPRYNPPYL